MVKEPSERHSSFEDLDFGIGQLIDGSIDIFPADQLDARARARDAEEAVSLDDMVRRINEDREFEVEMLEDAADAESDEEEARR